MKPLKRKSASTELNSDLEDNSSIDLSFSDSNITGSSDLTDDGDADDSDSLLPEIEAGYDSDSSTGSLDLTDPAIAKLYDEYPHIGYDINGKRIMRPTTKTAIESLLDQIEYKDEAIERLNQEQLDTLRKIADNVIPDAEFNPYPDYVDWFTHEIQQLPITNRSYEPKKRFVPSKSEQIKIFKLAKAIKEGRIILRDAKSKEENLAENVIDLWKDDEEPTEKHVMNLVAPKLLPPGTEYSYNPPEEYIDKDNTDDTDDFKANKYSSLRLVPAWSQSVRDVFERCLDLYLAPRIRRNKLDMDPNLLLPKLPSLSELKPFPTKFSFNFNGHNDRIRSCSLLFGKQYLATGGDDGILRIWDISIGETIWKKKLGETIQFLEWNPVKPILAVICGSDIYMILPDLFDSKLIDNARIDKNNVSEDSQIKWQWENSKEYILTKIPCKGILKTINWHRKGDYLVSTSSQDDSNSILIHQLSQCKSQIPFKKIKGQIQVAKFHPLRPWLVIATQTLIRIYDLALGEKIRTLQTGLKWISSLDIHRSGDHLIVGSYDRRLAWFDLDMGNKPYKVIRSHKKAIRDVKFHPTLPLFLSCSDDGSIQVYYGKVYSDFTNPLIVPVQNLGNHSIVNELGVLQATWVNGPNPWCITVGADSLGKLWT